MRCYSEPGHLADRIRMGHRVFLMSWEAFQELGKRPDLAGRLRLLSRREAAGIRFAIAASVPQETLRDIVPPASTIRP